jgi:hypothetical protein
MSSDSVSESPSTLSAFHGQLARLSGVECDAHFDGQSAGARLSTWHLAQPDSVARRALVLYLLPLGAIRFTG